jgi:hypothetical protein
MNREETLIWCAGFFEASGVVQISRPSIAVTISGRYLPPLQNFRRKIGSGSIVQLSSGSYRWEVTGYGAGVVLQSVLPWLDTKYELALLAITLANTVRSAGGPKIKPDIIQKREQLAKEIQRLKQKERNGYGYHRVS